MTTGGPEIRSGEDHGEGDYGAVDALADAGLIARLSRAASLLIGLDFDGTLAPIVDRPEMARASAGMIEAIRCLAELDLTRVAVISGRAIEDLRERLGRHPGVRLIGSHGGEWDDRDTPALTTPQAALLERVVGIAREIAAEHPGTSVETKPTSVALHYREADVHTGRAALVRAMAGPALIPGVLIKPGSMVLELGVVHTSKGDALARLRGMLRTERTVFIGDDVTDEDAFAVLSAADVAVKVGPGSTTAGFRVPGPDEVEDLLCRLGEARRRWLARS